MEKIIEKLISVGYSENVAEKVAKELSEIDDSLNEPLIAWIGNNVETDMTVKGFTLSELMIKYKMSYPAALLTIDWLIKDPQTATMAITHGIK